LFEDGWDVRSGGRGTNIGIGIRIGIRVGNDDVERLGIVVLSTSETVIYSLALTD
jgi:hypothetical protein